MIKMVKIEVYEFATLEPVYIDVTDSEYETLRHLCKKTHEDGKSVITFKGHRLLTYVSRLPEKPVGYYIKEDPDHEKAVRLVRRILVDLGIKSYLTGIEINLMRARNPIEIYPEPSPSDVIHFSKELYDEVRRKRGKKLSEEAARIFRYGADLAAEAPGNTVMVKVVESSRVITLEVKSSGIRYNKSNPDKPYDDFRIEMDDYWVGRHYWNKNGIKNEIVAFVANDLPDDDPLKVRGCWIHELPVPKEIMVPTGKYAVENTKLMKQWKNEWKWYGTRVKPITKTEEMSFIPFMRVPRKERCLQPLKTLLEKWIKECE